MKKINVIFAMAAMVAAFASCNKNEVATQQGTSLSLTAGTETKTILRNGKEVRWASTDKLRVFDTENNGFTFITKASDVKEAVFTCDNWTGTTPVMAVHSNPTSFSGSSISGSVITANLNPTQKIYHQRSYGKESALSVGKITENGGAYSIETMKNCFALLQFTLLDTSVVSITMTGNNEEIIAGWVDVDYDALAAGNSFWTVNATKGGSKSIAVNPEGSGCKVKGNGAFADTTAYYISVLPQTLSKGLTLVMTRRDGKSATREIKSSITLERGKIKTFAEAVDKDLTYKFSDIVLDFTTVINSTFKYDRDGTTSNLPQRSSGTSATTPADTDFWAAAYPSYKFNGAVRFWNTGGGALNMLKDTYVRFPRISGYKLTSISEVKVVHSSARKYKITSATAATYAAGTAVTGGEEQSLSLSSAAATFTLTDKYDANKDYYIVADNEPGFKFKLTYKPVE